MFKKVRRYEHLLIIIFCIVLFYHTIPNNIEAESCEPEDCPTTVQIFLEIKNAFNSFQKIQQDLFQRNDVNYVNNRNVKIEFGAGESSSYSISGPFTQGIIQGSGKDSYAQTVNLHITGADGLKEINSQFNNDSQGISNPETIRLFLDTTLPTVPSLISSNLTNDKQNLHLKRTESQDEGSGIKEYLVYISTNPSMLNPIIYTTSNTFIDIPVSLLNLQDVYRYTEAKDNANNASYSKAGFFKFPSNLTQEEINKNGRGFLNFLRTVFYNPLKRNNATKRISVEEAKIDNKDEIEGKENTQDTTYPTPKEIIESQQNG